MSPSSSSAAPLDQSQEKASFKDKLDQAAENARQPDSKQETHQPNLAEKVVEYIPAAAKIIGTGNQQQSEPAPSQPVSGPPDRPHHDGHIEEFVRDQHRSKIPDGGTNTGAGAGS
ncbi:hypothetical protein M426DRAFT_325344 [Hypoxylon sp. CI-4A]|nr:hypothetical protein M426DRAFT_325344 [Hypoxylon sp. CI-4A]